MSLEDVHHLLDTGHWIIPFLSVLVLQIGTMKCFYCPQKDASLVPGIHYPPVIKLFCRTSILMLVRRQFATYVFAVHAPVLLQPPFFRHLIISPPINGFWAAGAFGSSSCVWCSHVFGHRVCCRVFYCCHRVCHRVCYTPTEHITMRWSEGTHKPSRLDTFKKAKQPRMLKKVTIAQRVEKYGKYGLYDNKYRLYCKPCALKTNFLIGTGDKTCKKILVRELNHCHLLCRPGHIPLDHCLTLTYYSSGTMYRPRDNFFFKN